MKKRNEITQIRIALGVVLCVTTMGPFAQPVSEEVSDLIWRQKYVSFRANPQEMNTANADDNKVIKSDKGDKKIKEDEKDKYESHTEFKITNLSWGYLEYNQR